MRFFNSAFRLAKEIVSLKRYKKMHLALAIVTGGVLFPFFVCFFVGIGLLFVLSILFSIIQAPLTYIHNVLREEGEKVKHATQFIIYFISWPVVFVLYCFYASLTLLIHILYILSTALGYVVSLGAIRFHIDPEEENIAKEVEKEDQYPLLIPLIFDCVLGTLIILYIVSMLLVRNAFDWGIDWDVAEVFAKVNVISLICYCVIPCLYVPIVFDHIHLNYKPAPKAPKEPKPVKEKKVEKEEPQAEEAPAEEPAEEPSEEEPKE